MRINDFIVAKTHADFLNQLLNRNYKAFMQCGLSLPDGKWLWMIELSHKPSKSGWRNMLLDKDTLVEEFVGEHFDYERHNTYVGWKSKYTKLLPQYPYRVVFEFVKFDTYRKYVFRGMFMINEEKSTRQKNIWNKISDKYEFNI